MKLNILKTGFLTVALASCATPPALLRTDTLHANPKLSYLAFHLQFTAADPNIQSDGCEIKLFPAKGQGSFSLPVSVKDQFVMAEIEPDTYSLKEIYCYSDAHWTGISLGTTTPIHITEKSVNYLGSLKIDVGTTENLSMGFHSQEQTAKNLEGWLRTDAKGIQSRIKSAFSEKPITLSMFKKEGSALGLNYVFKKGAKKPDESEFHPVDIDFCIKSSEHNPIRMGRLKIIGRYEKDKTPEIVREQDESTYSAEFADCVEKHMRVFEWHRPGQVEITFKM